MTLAADGRFGVARSWSASGGVLSTKVSVGERFTDSQGYVWRFINANAGWSLVGATPNPYLGSIRVETSFILEVPFALQGELAVQGDFSSKEALSITNGAARALYLGGRALIGGERFSIKGKLISAADLMLDQGESALDCVVEGLLMVEGRLHINSPCTMTGAGAASRFDREGGLLRTIGNDNLKVKDVALLGDRNSPTSIFTGFIVFASDQPGAMTLNEMIMASDVDPTALDDLVTVYGLSPDFGPPDMTVEYGEPAFIKGWRGLRAELEAAGRANLRLGTLFRLGYLTTVAEVYSDGVYVGLFWLENGASSLMISAGDLAQYETEMNDALASLAPDELAKMKAHWKLEWYFAQGVTPPVDIQMQVEWADSGPEPFEVGLGESNSLSSAMISPMSSHLPQGGYTKGGPNTDDKIYYLPLMAQGYDCRGYNHDYENYSDCREALAYTSLGKKSYNRYFRILTGWYRYTTRIRFDDYTTTLWWGSSRVNSIAYACRTGGGGCKGCSCSAVLPVLNQGAPPIVLVLLVVSIFGLFSFAIIRTRQVGVISLAIIRRS